MLHTEHKRRIYMDIQELINKLTLLGESEKIEAKTGQEVGKSILQTICAYANEPDLGGGYLLLGIKKEEKSNSYAYHPTGITNPEKIVEDLVSQCRTTFNQPIPIQAEQHIVDEKVIISIFAPEVLPGKKPIYFKGQGLPHGAFRRMGSSDVQCTEDDLLVLLQGRETESYDYTVVSDAEWSDIDPEAIEDYRKERTLVHPQAKELLWTDEQLLLSLGCLKNHRGELKPTVAGILLFGTAFALRRLFPLARIDYIREPGVTWISDPKNRFTSAEIRAPLLDAIRRTISAIMDDIPKAFSLPEGSIQRKDIPIIPMAAVREAVVNAVMHRNYRPGQPIQVIRYANRIEVRNAGYSLISEEHLGQPYSKSRNVKIAQTLHDTHFSENKGSGIRIMREAMQEAGLSPPLFDSDRSKDMFVATFLFHHFLSKEDLDWLKSFKKYHLTDEQARALIFVREVGAIDNSSYRNLNHVDTLTASTSLRQLRDLDLLMAKNQSSATYYVPGPVFMDSLLKPSETNGKQHMVEAKQHMLFDSKEHMPILENENPPLTKLIELPEELQKIVGSLGKKTSVEKIEQAVLALCAWKDFTAEQLALIVKRDKNRLTRICLSPMIEKELLVYKYPEMPKHPNQTYSINKTRKKK